MAHALPLPEIAGAIIRLCLLSLLPIAPSLAGAPEQHPNNAPNNAPNNSPNNAPIYALINAPNNARWTCT
jgi:hypothetical protein